MNGYEQNIRLERKFAKDIKCILGMTFIGQDAELDRNQATDFYVLNIKPFTVACRLRTYNYYLNPRYTDQFTIRCELYSGGKTELTKIREGFADYMLYGFVDEKEMKRIDKIDSKKVLDMVKEYLNKIHPNYKIIIEECYLMDKKISEIAQERGIPEQNVRMLLSRA